VLTRYPCVVEVYKNGVNLSFIKTKQIILKIEQSYKVKHDKPLLYAIDKRAFNAQIKAELSREKLTKPDTIYAI
jgi:hypothetical protein